MGRLRHLHGNDGSSRGEGRCEPSQPGRLSPFVMRKIMQAEDLGEHDADESADEMATENSPGLSKGRLDHTEAEYR